MAERAFPNSSRPASGTPRAPTPTDSGGIVLDPVVLKGTLTPKGLFTNLFPVTLGAGSIGPVRAAATEKAQKDEFEGWRRPLFYQAGDILYAFGPGLEDFKDRRFSSAIVTAETNLNFTKHLLGIGLVSLFRAKGFIVQREAQGFTVRDHNNIILSSKKGVLHIIPQFNFQPYWVECTSGAIRFAFAIEPGTTTLPTFHIHTGLRRFAAELDGLRLQLNETGCKPGCPLYGREGEVLGRFAGFAGPDASLDCTCHEASFDAIAIHVVDRRKKPGTLRRRQGDSGPKPGLEEIRLTIPGQLVVAAPAQRKLLRLSRDRDELERAGRIWLGDLATNRKVRGNALRVRYERIQEFLAHMAGSAVAPLPFTLPTGATAQVERIPLIAEEIVDED